MSWSAFLRPDVHGCCAKPASKLSPALRPRMRRAFTVRVPMPCPTVRDPCCQTATEAWLRPQTDVQISCSQRAAHAAPTKPLGQRCAPRARLAVARSRERTREAETEGKIKEAARLSLPSQSARGLGAAPRLRPAVPRRHAMSRGAWLLRVPLPLHCAMLRWSWGHGFA